jgi:hypothetical protein
MVSGPVLRWKRPDDHLCTAAPPPRPPRTTAPGPSRTPDRHHGQCRSDRLCVRRQREPATRTPKTAPGQTLKWDDENHLAEVDITGANPSATKYLYDADGNQLLRRDPARPRCSPGTPRSRSTRRWSRRSHWARSGRTRMAAHRQRSPRACDHTSCGPPQTGKGSGGNATPGGSDSDLPKGTAKIGADDARSLRRVFL